MTSDPLSPRSGDFVTLNGSVFEFLAYFGSCATPNPGALFDDLIDATAAIDAAEVAGGVVVFTTGTYRIDGTLRVEASDVVLRGEGADATSRSQTPASSRRETRWRLVGRSRPSSSLSTE